jgi:hypothetical protein
VLSPVHCAAAKSLAHEGTEATLDATNKLSYENPRDRLQPRPIPWFGLISLIEPCSTIALGIVKLFGAGGSFGAHLGAFPILSLPIIGMGCGIVGLCVDKTKAAAKFGLLLNLLLLTAIGFGWLGLYMANLH